MNPLFALLLLLSLIGCDSQASGAEPQWRRVTDMPPCAKVVAYNLGAYDGAIRTAVCSDGTVWTK